MINIYFDNCEAEDFRTGELIRHEGKSYIITGVKWTEHGVWLHLEFN